MPIEFVLDLADDISPNLFVSKSDGVVTVDLGDDPATGLSYSLWCALQPCIVPLGAMEFSFWIADYDPETRHMDKIWHGCDTKHLIPENDRRLWVLWLVGVALRELCRRFEPACVFIQTMTPDLQPKALVKYEYLGTILHDLGYDFRKVDPYHGYEAWIAKIKEQ